MAQAGVVWVPVLPELRGFVTKVDAETKQIKDVRVTVTATVDTGRATGDLDAFRAGAEARVGHIRSSVDLDTGEAAAQLGRWDAEAYALAGQIPSNVNVDTTEAAGHVDAFEADSKRKLETLTSNVNIDTGEATGRVDAFEGETKRKLETITSNINVDTGHATERVDAFEAETKRKLESTTANITVDTGHATERVDAFEAETKRKLETVTANINVDTGRATERVDTFEAETKRKLETTTANITVDTGRATAKVDQFEANTKRKIESITGNINVDTGVASAKVDEFEGNTKRKLETVTANVDVDTGRGAEKVDTFQANTHRKLDHIPMNVDADTGTADAKVDSFRGHTREKIGNQTSNIDADTRGATNKVDTFQANSHRKLRDITANINADTGRATARIHVWKAEMNRYVNNPITAFPVVNTSVATGQLVAWKGMAQGLVGTIHSTLTLDIGGVFGGITQIIEGIAQAYMGVLAFANAWGIAFVAVAGVIALIGSLGPLIFALVGGLATIPALAVGAGFAIGTLLIGFQGLGAAISAAFDPTKASEFQAAMAKLSPEARKTVLAIQALNDNLAITNLRTEVQDALFRGIADLIPDLGAFYLPLATRGFVAMADGINSAVRAFAGFLLMPQVMSQLAYAESQVVAGFQIFASGSEQWGEALTTLAAVGSNQLPRMAAGFADLGREFNAFIDRTAATGELDAFLTNSVDELGVLIDLVGQLGRVIIGVFTAAGTSGVDLVRMLDAGTKAFADWLDTAEGFSRMRDLFEASYQTMRNLSPLLEAIGGFFAGPGMTTFIEYAPEFGRVFGDLAGLVPGLAFAFDHLTGGVLGVLDAETPLLYSLVYGLGPAFLDLIDMVFALTNLISGGLTAAIWALQGPINFIAGLMRSVTGWANSMGFSSGGIVVEHRATGGVIPGYEPGVDRVPALLSPGEGVLVPEAVRALGPGFIGWANQHYSGGRSSGGDGTSGAFATGGIVLRQTISPVAASAASLAPSMAGMSRGGIVTGIEDTAPAAAQQRRQGVTQVNNFNVPIDEQAFAAATIRRLDFAQRMSG